MLSSVIELVIYVSAAIMVMFALSQAWLAWQYRIGKSRSTGSLPAQWTGELPRVLLQLPIYNERFVVERLLRAAALMDYPRDRLTIQLLDDSTDETTSIAARTIADLAAQGVTNIVHVRRADRKGFKAGALQAGLSLDDSEFVAIFDADFIPRADFVKRIIGYFSNPRVGMVQTRWEHLNANYSLITKLLSFGIDNHFSVEQGGRQATHAFINFNGTAGMWRRQTIMDTGGWHDDCLTEDLDLSFRAQMLGWQFLFVEEITTPSELPVQMSAIRSQQYRWTKGAAETGKKSLGLFWTSNQSLSTKIIGSFHMLNSCIFVFVLAFGLAVAAHNFWVNPYSSMDIMPVKLIIVIFLVAAFFTYWTAQNSGGFAGKRKSPVEMIYTMLMFMAVTTGLTVNNGVAVAQGLRGKVTPFIRTPKLAIGTPGEISQKKHSYGKIRLPFEFFVEGALMVLFVFATLFAIAHGNYAFIDLFVFFSFGFGLVVYLTIREVFFDSHSTLQPAAA